MGLDEIRQAVLGSAETEAARIRETAQARAAEKAAAEKEQARQEAERRYAARVRAIEEEFARKLIQFNGAAGKQLLDKRNACLRGILDRARESIVAWPAETYAEVMCRLIARAAGNSGGQLCIHPEDTAVFEEALAQVNAARDAEERLAINEAQPLARRGGFVFVSRDFEVDQTLDTILAELEHELIPEIAAELFSA